MAKKPPAQPEELERLRLWLNPPPPSLEPDDGEGPDPVPRINRDDIKWIVANYAKVASRLETAQATLEAYEAQALPMLAAGGLAAGKSPIDAVIEAHDALEAMAKGRK